MVIETISAHADEALSPEKEINYNDLYKTASENRDDKQECGDTWREMSPQWVNMVEKALVKGRESGLRKFYVHIFIQKDTVSSQILRWVPMVRRTRPSPYKAWDHYLYKWSDDVGVTFEWAVPRPEVATFVANNPEKFHPSYVEMMRKFCQGTLE